MLLAFTWLKSNKEDLAVGGGFVPKLVDLMIALHTHQLLQSQLICPEMVMSDEGRSVTMTLADMGNSNINCYLLFVYPQGSSAKETKQNKAKQNCTLYWFT